MGHANGRKIHEEWVIGNIAICPREGVLLMNLWEYST